MLILGSDSKGGERGKNEKKFFDLFSRLVGADSLQDREYLQATPQELIEELDDLLSVSQVLTKEGMIQEISLLRDGVVTFCLEKGECPICGYLLVEITHTDWEPWGDTMAPRESINIKCEGCGEEF